MSEREQTKVNNLQWGIVISSILPLVGWYLYNIDLAYNKNDMYGFNEMALVCIGGIIILLGIAGVILFLIRLIKSPERPSGSRFSLTMIFPFGIWALVIASILINPLGTYHMRYQSKMGKHNFRHVNMEQANLSSIDLTDADLSGANFENANLRDASFIDANFTNTILNGADLRGASFGGANLSRVDLSERDLKGTWFPDADLSNANLHRADFSGTNFNVAILIGTDLTETDLTGANFAYADLTGANLTGAELSNVNMVGANLSSAVISDEQLIHASNLRKATMPNKKMYDGRFNLASYLEEFNNNHPGESSPAEIANWYDVSLEEYLAGQEWAEENLLRLRGDDGE